MITRFFNVLEDIDEMCSDGFYANSWVIALMLNIYRYRYIHMVLGDYSSLENDRICFKYGIIFTYRGKLKELW